MSGLKFTASELPMAELEAQLSRIFDDGAPRAVVLLAQVAADEVKVLSIGAGYPKIRLMAQAAIETCDKAEALAARAEGEPKQ